MTPDQTDCAELLKNLVYELDGVIADYEAGKGFDEVCLRTVKRVREAIAALTAQQGVDTVAEPIKRTILQDANDEISKRRNSAVAEPVAWAHHLSITSQITPQQKREWATDITERFSIPLYTHPAPSPEAVARSEVVVPRDVIDAIKVMVGHSAGDDLEAEARIVEWLTSAAAPTSAKDKP